MGRNSAEKRVLSSTQLRREIHWRNLERGNDAEREVSYGASQSVIFQGDEETHGNFLPAAYARILANPEWARRLTKSYTASRFVPRAGDRKRCELECASSSDALLMNIFCYPGVLRNARVCALLGIEPGLRPEFGFRPAMPLKSGRVDRTEMDMRLGELLVEAKLTEGDFQRAPARLVERYRDLDEVFDVERLPVVDGVVRSYQLIRSVLAAHARGGSFVVLCDGRRPDLVERWFEVLQAVTDSALRTRMGLVTWQEIGAALPAKVQRFLQEKYGIGE
ncbi:MAG TPA: hypothetical protein VHZ25_09140 [Acidobacteriaceae bacterium]|jgi:hypothetical protein|nr:hypothetical protein [Acidobacteriaceae bacterium]